MEHAGLRIGALRRHVYELRLPLALPASCGHNSWRRHLGALQMHSKDAQGPEEHAGLRIGALRRHVYELLLPLAVPVSGGNNS